MGKHPYGSQLPGQEMTFVTFSPMLLTNAGHEAPTKLHERLENRECCESSELPSLPHHLKP